MLDGVEIKSFSDERHEDFSVDGANDLEALLTEEYPASNIFRPHPRFRQCISNTMSELRRRFLRLNPRTNPGGLSKELIVEQRVRLTHGTVRSLLNSLLALLCVGALCALVFVQSRTLDIRRHRPTWADPHHSIHWTNDQRVSNFSTEDIQPLPYLSHNDESRAIPLFTGLSYGCMAVEADIWLRENTLFVGHDARSLRPGATLKTMYLEPLQNILEGRSGQPHVKDRIYQDQDSQKPFALMLDFKSQIEVEAVNTLNALEHALHPLRQARLLSYYDQEAGTLVNRPLFIVASGDVPFDVLTSTAGNYHRDIFFDAPLQWIWEDNIGRKQLGRRPGKGQGRAGTSRVSSAIAFNQTNSYLASMSFKSLYWPPLLGLSKRQKAEIEEQINAAHDQGLRVRYWGTWDSILPVAARRKLWRQLTQLGVDMMNVDAIEEFAKND